MNAYLVVRKLTLFTMVLAPLAIMAYKESNFQTEFKKKNDIFGVFELKICKGVSFPFSRLPDHQLDALRRAKNGSGTYWKLPDVGYAQKPFDCFFLGNTDSYIVIMFYTKRIKKNVYYVSTDSWLEMLKKHPRKSIRESEVSNIAEYFFNYLSR